MVVAFISYREGGQDLKMMMFWFVLQVANRVHAPGRARVIGTLHNSAEFARAYNCPVGSPMNPRRSEGRCALY